MGNFRIVFFTLLSFVQLKSKVGKKLFSKVARLNAKVISGVIITLNWFGTIFWEVFKIVDELTHSIIKNIQQN